MGQRRPWPLAELNAFQGVTSWSTAASFEVALTQSDYTMNIFTIIGVVVVIVVVAGYFGLRV